MAPRVLMVLESWGAGGTEAFVRQLIAWLRGRTGAGVSVCLLRADEAARRAATPVLADTVDDIHVLGATITWATFGRLHALLRNRRPDVCHLHLYSSLLPAVVAARAARIPRIVTTLHMPLWQWSLRHRLAWRLAVAASHCVTGGSSATLRSVGRWPEAPSNRRVAPPLAVQTYSVSQRAGSHAVRTGEVPLVVAGVGRLSKEKCWDVLLGAVHLLDASAPGTWCVRLFGEGPRRDALSTLAAGLGISHVVHFEGFVPFEQLTERLGDCDVCVLPSQFEGLGMAAIEAMALGVPTITADFEASADFIEHGVTGHTFPRGDAEALAERLRWHRDHPEEAAAVARQGQAFVRERFHPDAVFAPMPAIYGRELAGSKNGVFPGLGSGRASEEG